jgi:uncharacterized protein YbjT (DUF2867 family)
MTVLVTGATGTVGAAVVRALTARGVHPHTLVRTPRGPGARVADFADPATLPAAFAGADRVFLLCGNHPDQVRWETAAIDAAAAAGVRRIVKMSALGARAGSPVAFLDAHARIEDHLRGCGVPWVSLRPAFLMSNLLGSAPGVRQAGALFLPAAGAKVAMVDPRDVAEVAAAVLTGDGHDGRTYELTGPEAVTFDEVAGELSAALGRPVAFVPVPDADARAQMVAAGLPPWYADNVVTQMGQLRSGAQDRVGDTVAALTGREPRAVGEFLRDHATAFTT